jgi:uncharacterized protein YdiU (UPF0061 family)
VRPPTDLPALRLDDRLRSTLPELVVDWQAAETPDPQLVVFNDELADELGVSGLDNGPGARVLSGSLVVPGSHPVAMAYAGHQFGSYSPLLGDGRALLLGELRTPDGTLVDLHLKGSGRTPFARGGDGRAALGPMLREYLVSEAMSALGIPTTRALAVLTTGDRVHRAGDDIGAVLVRVAASHLRVGTFEYAARLPDPTVLERLAAHAIERHHPDAADAPVPALALLDAVVGVQAELVARWMLVGFIHGVMNTDNTTISGETIDYGPCAFMNRYDPDTVFSSIDHGGRYRFGHQPAITEWNLTRLGESLLGLMGDDLDASIEAAREVLRSFMPRYRSAWTRGMRSKLGLRHDRPDDAELFDDLLEAMQTDGADLTLTFRMLADELRRDAALVSTPVAHGAAVASWIPRWRARLDREGRDPAAAAHLMDDVNPVYVPRNHLVEEVLGAAMSGDLQPFEELLAVLTRPYTTQPGAEALALPPGDEFDRYYQTFCGT